MATDTVKVQTRVGPSNPVADGSSDEYLRTGRQGELILNLAGGEYEEACSRGELYCACNQAEVTYGTALTATAVTFTLYNPVGSTHDLVLLQIGIATRTSSTAGHLVLAANVNNAAAAPATNTELTIRNCKLDGSAGVAKAYSATTLPAAPLAIMALMSMGVTVTGEGQFVDVKGGVILGPNTAVTVQGITVVGTGIISMTWRERKRLAA